MHPLRDATQVGRTVRTHDGAFVPVGGRSSGSWMWHLPVPPCPSVR